MNETSFTITIFHSPRQSRHAVRPTTARQVCRGLFVDRSCRRGGAYIAVLGAAVLVTIIGLSAIAVVRVQSQAARTTADLSQARQHARSAIDLARQWIADDPGVWRTEAQAGTGKWGREIALAHGQLQVRVEDPYDNDLIDEANDSVVLTGIGRVGRARQRLEVRLEPYRDSPPPDGEPWPSKMRPVSNSWQWVVD